MDKNIENAVITEASIVIERGFVLDVWIQCSLETGGTQGFGGWALYLTETATHHKIDSPAGHHIAKIMEMADVHNFKHLEGKTIRVAKDKPSFAGKIIGIGHIIKDKWYYPEDVMKKTYEKAGR